MNHFNRFIGRMTLFSLFIFISICIHQGAYAQDSLMFMKLSEIVIEDNRDDDHSSLPDIEPPLVFAGKKTDQVNLNDPEINRALNLGRKIFSKIPGINLWDMDGAGTQLNLGTRGTDAHRSIEMNMRQNGYNTNSDMFGYPENHYSVAMQGVEKIQLVRGSAALQFGSQFGAMMNYIMKDGDDEKVIAIESEQTYGSNNFFNSFNSIGGTKGKFNYYAFYDDRHGDGWRPNSKFQYKSWYGSLKYHFNTKGSIAFQFSRMHYEQQIAGGQTDEQFREDRKQSNRSRNFFSPTINIPAIAFNYQFGPTDIQIITHGIWGDRSSLQFIATPNIEDTFNISMGSYNPRQIDRDYYYGFTTEGRLLHRYRIGKVSSILSSGIRFYHQKTQRRQKGTGTSGSNFNFELKENYGIDLIFHTINYALFAENIFQLSKKVSLTPGVRYEIIQSDLDGLIENRANQVSYSGTRSFPLFGLGLQYLIDKNIQMYGNISQAYRPYLYSQVTPADQVAVIDPNLEDSKGYQADIGLRGSMKRLNYDINYFYLYYGKRIGKLLINDDVPHIYTTNIGNSIAYGTETYLNFMILERTKTNMGISVFSSISYTHATYEKGEVTKNGENVSLAGNMVEGVPQWIVRSGFELNSKRLFSSLQHSYTSKKYNDAFNTNYDPTGTVGLVPAYSIWDWSIKWEFSNTIFMSGSINNLLDAKYFSRRIASYPGPGILPGDGRTFYLSLGFTI